MNRTLVAPFQAIDIALADRVCKWHNTTDELLWQTIAATSYALHQGHSCLSINQCLQEHPYKDMVAVGGIEFPERDPWLKLLDGFDLTADSNSPVVIENDRIYLRRYWAFESELADFFSARIHETIPLSAGQLKQAKVLLANYFPNTESVSNPEIDWQELAAINCLLSSTNIIIGGPGTGKTYTVTRILALLANLSDHPPLIKLAAPTGKAAQRLGESIRDAKLTLNLDMLIEDALPDEAMTIHRLLGVVPNELHFRHTADNPIEADILLIDEVSMVDLPLMTRLCRAIKPTTRLILLGDADQLPSVAAGSVLADLVIKPHPGFSAARVKAIQKVHPKLPLSPLTGSGSGLKESSTQSEKPLDYVTELKVSRRFNDGSGIGTLAKQVISGQPNESLKSFQNFDDLTWLNDIDFDAMLTHWTRTYFNGIAQSQNLTLAFLTIKSFRILCALREGERGVNRINERIQTSLNYNRQPFYKGQPIMISQNHYGLKLFNGDVGLVWPDETGQLMAWFEAQEQPRAVALGRLPSVETVYAMTIHKTQGSEFENVAMVLPESHSSLLTRELIYTGLTRAKKTFSCIGNHGVWEQGVKAQVERWAGLSHKLNAE